MAQLDLGSMSVALEENMVKWSLLRHVFKQGLFFTYAGKW